MARPLRIEYAGALYHVTSRGDGQEDIYREDADRVAFLGVIGDVCERFNWVMHAYCLMDNHYHLLVETPNANLAKGMRQLNGVYTQTFNRTHARVGHVFQSRYKAILVQKETYLLELARLYRAQPGSGTNGAKCKGLVMEQLSCNGRASRGHGMAPNRLDPIGLWSSEGQGNRAVSGICRGRQESTRAMGTP